MNFEKLKMISSHKEYNGRLDSKKQITEEYQNIFNEYLENQLNSEIIYKVSENREMLASFYDVSDLEINTDTKWVLTNVNDNLDCGDYFIKKNATWLVVYDKEKNNNTCSKVKAIPCQHKIKLVKKENGNINIKEYYGILNNFQQDTRDYKQPLPSENGVSFFTVTYSEYVKDLKIGDRLMIIDKAYRIVGEDYSSVNGDTMVGVIKYTIRKDKIDVTNDNVEIGVCDYYRITGERDNINDNANEGVSVNFMLKESKIQSNSNTKITSNYDFKVEFYDESNTLNCILKKENNRSWIISSTNNTGILEVMCTTNSGIKEKIRVLIM